MTLYIVTSIICRGNLLISIIFVTYFAMHVSMVIFLKRSVTCRLFIVRHYHIITTFHASNVDRFFFKTSWDGKFDCFVPCKKFLSSGFFQEIQENFHLCLYQDSFSLSLCVSVRLSLSLSVSLSLSLSLSLSHFKIILQSLPI